MLLSNILSNKLDDFFDISDNKNFISCRQKRNMINSRILFTRRNKVADHFKIKKKVAGRNKVASYFGMKQRIESANNDLSDIRFFIEEE